MWITSECLRFSEWTVVSSMDSILSNLVVSFCVSAVVFLQISGLKTQTYRHMKEEWEGFLSSSVSNSVHWLPVCLCLAAPDDVRLVGGASRCAGILERRDGGDWRAVNVSLSEWNLTSAETVCRQLDCGSVLSFRPPETSSRTEPPPDSRNLQITCSGEFDFLLI